MFNINMPKPENLGESTQEKDKENMESNIDVFIEGVVEETNIEGNLKERIGEGVDRENIISSYVSNVKFKVWEKMREVGIISEETSKEEEDRLERLVISKIEAKAEDFYETWAK